MSLFRKMTALHTSATGLFIRLHIKGGAPEITRCTSTILSAACARKKRQTIAVLRVHDKVRRTVLCQNKYCGATLLVPALLPISSSVADVEGREQALLGRTANYRYCYESPTAGTIAVRGALAKIPKLTKVLGGSSFFVVASCLPPSASNIRTSAMLATHCGNFFLYLADDASVVRGATDVQFEKNDAMANHSQR